MPFSTANLSIQKCIEELSKNYKLKQKNTSLVLDNFFEFEVNLKAGNNIFPIKM